VIICFFIEIEHRGASPKTFMADIDRAMSKKLTGVTNDFVMQKIRFVSVEGMYDQNIVHAIEKQAHLDKEIIMNNWKKNLFWLLLTALIFSLFRWLSGIAMPEIALPFSIGTTFVIVAGLFTGRAVTLISLRNADVVKWGTITGSLSGFIFVAFLCIAFLLNGMIEKTTFFPFAVTVLLVFLISSATSALITVIRQQYKSKVRSAQAAMAQSKSELQLLQSQLSPHFLFNTLNNLYGLSLNSPDKVPSLLLKLSELLRYSVYDVKEVFVPLQHEVDYILNYIEFERLRLGDRLTLRVDVDRNFDPDCKIPPLLLVVFIENAFKHSRHAAGEQITIDLALQGKGNSLIFSVRNSCAIQTTGGQGTEKHSGFGLDSVRKRLNMLYAGKHDLRIKRMESEYAVELTIPCR
jgi:hypothetical protein